jgi:hypothetical protein
MNVVEAQNVTCHVDRELMYVRIVVVRKVELTQPLSTQQNSQTSPFLKLPGEIRNRIYHFAFCNMVLRVLPPLGSLSVLMTEQDLAFSTTYRPIYYEATPISTSWPSSVSSTWTNWSVFLIVSMRDIDLIFGL